MVKRGTDAPRKLTNDAIIEALLEVRFQTKSIFPEVFIGRFLDTDPWRNWQQRQLPAYNIPAQIRTLEPNIQFSPIIEVAEPAGKALLRVGTSVVSYHRKAPYVGWEKFKPELLRVINALFKASSGLIVRRLGFRYLNSLRSKLHGIRSIADLDLKMTVAEDPIEKYVNLNFTVPLEHASSCAVRIATPELIQGPIPEDTTVFVDVDVYTNEGFSTTEKKMVDDWIEFAHEQEKKEFFHLFKQSTIDVLREE